MGSLIATQRAGQLNFILRDHLGSTRVVVSSDGTSGVGYAYDALGNVVEQSAFGTPTSAIAYRYTGQEFDGETGLHNFRARLYDSDLFRFYATDPAGEGFTPYAFVGNSPFLFTDPSGKNIYYFDSNKSPFPYYTPASGPHLYYYQTVRDGIDLGFHLGPTYSFTSDELAILTPMSLDELKERGVLDDQSFARIIEDTDYLGISPKRGGTDSRPRWANRVIVDNRDHGTIRQYEPNIFGSLAESGIVGGMIYRILNAPFVAGQVPFVDNPRNLDNSIASRKEILDAGIGTLAAMLPAGQTGVELATMGIGAGDGAKGGLTNPQLVQRSATLAERAIGGKGPVAGIAKHKYATQLLDRYQSIYGHKGLFPNHSFNNGVGNRGILDVLDRTNGVIYDFKFGKAVMRPAQYNKYYNNFGLPIQIIRP